MHKLKLIFVLCLISMLVACTPEIVIKKEYVLVVPKDALIDGVASEPPPVKAEYIEKSWSEKEKILADIYRRQTINLEKANTQFRELRAWKQKETALFEERDKEERDKIKE